MVARSKGCVLCVQRRVKCDQRQPGCAKCETYGEPCPGYGPRFKFIVGKPYRTQRRRKSGSNQDGSSPESLAVVQSQPLRQRTNPLCNLSSIASADMNLSQCLCVLTQEISKPFAANSAHVTSRWFGFLPTVYGRSRTLDLTIKSFTAHQIGNLTSDPQAAQYARQLYVESLYRLRTSLGNSRECYSPEVFCAVMLLCLYELFTNVHDADAWMKHAKGLSQLVELRGAARCTTEFDHVLLKAARGLIVMYSLFSGQRCFLALEEWHTVMKQHPNSGLGDDLANLVEQFFAYFTSAPGLVHQLYDLKDADFTKPDTVAKASDLLFQVLVMQNKLSEWLANLSAVTPLPGETRSASGDLYYPTVLEYSDESAASIFCGYYSYMIIIHEILRVCGYPGDHSATVVYFRDQICKSVEYNARGLLGPYRMGFPLRVAYEVADPATRAWIEGRLERLSKVYAAVRPQNFG
ncbi:Zn(II)2Cys6 transcription factor domain-containing protein [Aspergillus brunneoviolaceus CBS 621.78]|uniref:C6 finger domain protein n=1 Tax=Aspergillus brunneoviolaceus CBS 621.78 TaxID=1450534 RepID=A0ACD1FTS8_9EURO|nr:putative C6 finger domain protein [Aspergillus brunneoviolaceus CBS 621.78]RAH40406.1 putative C6 finger domain protein [Aspergillus brunneoviolaceus CBS 621.78]